MTAGHDGKQAKRHYFRSLVNWVAVQKYIHVLVHDQYKH
jgi:hypothetical protein